MQDSPESSDCVLSDWTVSTKGYGQRWINGTTITHHRYVWMKANGPIPKGMYICHKCDVRLCINLDHLYLGTPTDNVRDCINKGRLFLHSEEGKEMLRKNSREIARRRYAPRND